MFLYQFPLSHYCEKVRWALDYKGISYQLVNILPGPHILRIRKMAPKTTVPVLVDKKRVIQDSTKILDYLEEHYPQKPLIPLNQTEKKESLAMEEYCDEEIGPHLRRFFYYFVLPRKKLAIHLLTQQGPTYGPLLYTFIFPLIRRAMQRSMNISATAAKRSEDRLLRAMERLNHILKNQKFLIGQSLSRADITAASLLAPLFKPPQHAFSWPSDKEIPPPLAAFTKAHENSTLHHWVLNLYQNYR